MAEKVENIGKREIIWSYAGTAFMIGAGVILLPFILHKMPQETVGIWNIFQTITALVLLLDFGFRPTFARNISYIFSGVKSLQRNGVAHTTSEAAVDYSLLKGTLLAMKRFYRWMALAVFALLATAGTAYFYYILQKYSGDRQDALIAWILLIAINCYNLYTFYYEALLTGKGYVTRAQQINMLGQAVYLALAIGLIYAGFGLTAIVASQLISTVIRRILTYRVFFTPELKANIESVEPQEPKEILSAISPNAVKIGLTQLGGFMVNKSAILIGSAFLTLEQVACYGITIQVMDILARCATVFYQSYLPKLAQCRAENDLNGLKRYYILCTGSLLAVYAVGSVAWIFLSPLHMGIWGLILAPGIAQLAYQNWKWPSVVIKEVWGK